MSYPVTETKTCQNCKTLFTIEPEDFAFYDKIHVPPPTFCPECRMVRRMLWANGRSLCKRRCGAPTHSEEVISKYASDLFTVYDHAHWWSDTWDPLSYGRTYDFSRPFFEQFRDLLVTIPIRNLDITNSVNCEYCPSVINCKDCYLVASGYMAEDCLYSVTPALSQRCVDSLMSIACNTLYECVSCTRCFNLAYGIHCFDCMDAKFLYDCRNCSDCFGCVGLRNKQYHIFNKPYAKKTYIDEVRKFNLGSYGNTRKHCEAFSTFTQKFPRKFAVTRNAVNCTGDEIENAKNCHWAFEMTMGAENCTYIFGGGGKLKDSYDVFGGGLKSELLYETSSVVGVQRVYFCDRVQNSFNILYSRECYNASNLFGCIGLRKKEYCILNKPYTKIDYEALVPKIIEHMRAMPYTDRKGRVYRYGEFFPPEISPFPYNGSSAQEYFPLSASAAEERGYIWHHTSERHPAVTITPDTLPDHIADVPDSIIQEVIGCAHAAQATSCNEQCTAAFRIIPPELTFYRKMNLPLPRLCPNCRHYQRMIWRNPWHLWHRACQCAGKKSEAQNSKSEASFVYENTATHIHGAEHCPNEFETSYAPERKEIVYCEQCYNAEVV